MARFCGSCLEADPSRVITMKPPARKSARKKTQRDYAGLNSGNESDPSRFLRMMEGKVIKKDPFKRMKGSEVGIEWLETDESAMKEPIVVETEEGLGMKMPPPGFTVDDVVEALGEDHPVEVIGTWKAVCTGAARGQVLSTEKHETHAVISPDLASQTLQLSQTPPIGRLENGSNIGTRNHLRGTRYGMSSPSRFLGRS